MKKLLLVFIVIAFVMTSCNVKSSKVEKFDTNNIIYVKDDRCDICYAVVASRKQMKAEQNGLGFTVVDCKKVEHLLEKKVEK